MPVNKNLLISCKYFIPNLLTDHILREINLMNTLKKFATALPFLWLGGLILEITGNIIFPILTITLTYLAFRHFHHMGII